MRVAIVAILIVCASCKKDSARTYPPGSGRPVEIACPKERPPGTARAEVGGSCKGDAECTAGVNGRCQTQGARVMENACTYDACFRDADCKAGPCECNSSGNRCLGGNCRTDTDCGSGGACGRSNAIGCGGGDATYYCRTPADTCTKYDDCKVDAQCVYAIELGHWTCQQRPQCPVG
jgi:hypothetical protein